ncbi:MAG: LOG family protein, partial [Clostridia bacterium]|nr:LOG family protein [Clostridia bacterium]
RERKALMEARSDAFIMTPGGIGTFEEFFEILTLKQLARHSKAIAVLNTKGYFDPMLAMMERSIADGFVTSTVGDLYYFTDEPEKVLDYLETYVPVEVAPSVYKKGVDDGTK